MIRLPFRKTGCLCLYLIYIKQFSVNAFRYNEHLPSLSVIQHYLDAVDTTPAIWHAAHDALSLASYKGNTKVIKYILTEHKISQYTVSQCMAWSCRNGHLESVAALIAAGADINFESGRPLLYAVLYSPNCVPVLLKAGADMNLQNSSAIRTACEHGNLETVHLLIDAKCELRGWIAEDAFLKALEHSHFEIAQVLLTKKVVSVNLKNGGYLVRSVRRRRTDIVTFLLDNGASMSVSKALQTAINIDYTEIIPLLHTRTSEIRNNKIIT